MSILSALVTGMLLGTMPVHQTYCRQGLQALFIIIMGFSPDLIFTATDWRPLHGNSVGDGTRMSRRYMMSWKNAVMRNRAKLHGELLGLDYRICFYFYLAGARFDIHLNNDMLLSCASTGQCSMFELH